MYRGWTVPRRCLAKSSSLFVRGPQTLSRESGRRNETLSCKRPSQLTLAFVLRPYPYGPGTADQCAPDVASTKAKCAAAIPPRILTKRKHHSKESFHATNLITGPNCLAMQHMHSYGNSPPPTTPSSDQQHSSYSVQMVLPTGMLLPTGMAVTTQHASSLWYAGPSCMAHIQQLRSHATVL
jgi:hypothetical protein